MWKTLDPLDSFPVFIYSSLPPASTDWLALITLITLRASLSGTFLQTLPDLVTPLKPGYRVRVRLKKADAEDLGTNIYIYNCRSNLTPKHARKHDTTVTQRNKSPAFTTPCICVPKFSAGASRYSEAQPERAEAQLVDPGKLHRITSNIGVRPLTDHHGWNVDAFPVSCGVNFMTFVLLYIIVHFTINIFISFWSVLACLAGKITLSSRWTGKCNPTWGMLVIVTMLLNISCVMWWTVTIKDWAFGSRVIIRRIGKHWLAPGFSVFRTRVHGCSHAELCHVPVPERHLRGDCSFWQLLTYVIPGRLLTRSEDSTWQMEVSTVSEGNIMDVSTEMEVDNWPPIDDFHSAKNNKKLKFLSSDMQSAQNVENYMCRNGTWSTTGNTTMIGFGPRFPQLFTVW